ncbi:Transposable element Tcb1 transposase [Merluccius polli]|uniref:Transposable element Tcb1 transposase n=1 Tax=Merluccius polli TaxID=89951 RepID=A0AA47M6X5_MERPO|nr:Transposable element Tcb1 transposase [Merluccius polli]
MKRRFHVLHGEIRLSPERASTVITVCAILHNLCKRRNIPQPDDEDDDDHDDDAAGGRGEAGGAEEEEELGEEELGEEVQLEEEELGEEVQLAEEEMAEEEPSDVMQLDFHLDFSLPIEHRVKATDYLSIVADHVHPFMTTVYPSSDGYFQQDNAPCHKARIISDWFLEHDNEFTVLKWPPHSPDLNPIEHLWDVVEREIRIMDVQPTNLQQLRDAIMSIWTKLSEECFQYLVESVPRRIKAVLKAKGGPTRY